MKEEAETRQADVKNASTAKSRQPLKFRVEGGLGKVADLYRTMDNDPEALDACWEDPGAYLKDFISDESVQLSKGYKKLADAMGTLDLSKLIEGYDPAHMNMLATSEDPAIARLRDAVCGTEFAADEILRAADISDTFNNPSVTVSVMMMMMVTITVTVTVTSGTSITPGDKPPSPAAMRQMQLAQLTAHAQNVADQLGWYARQ